MYVPLITLFLSLQRNGCISELFAVNRPSHYIEVGTFMGTILRALLPTMYCTYVATHRLETSVLDTFESNNTLTQDRLGGGGVSHPCQSKKNLPSCYVLFNPFNPLTMSDLINPLKNYQSWW